jgi:hypothetical protein
MEPLITRKRIYEITNLRIYYGVFFAVAFVITELGRKIYRPYIYRHHLEDFGMADTIGNSMGTMAIVFFELALINPQLRQGKYIILFITLGVIGYELTQYFLPGRNTCDWKDILATLIAGGVSFLFFIVLNKIPLKQYWTFRP